MVLTLLLHVTIRTQPDCSFVETPGHVHSVFARCDEFQPEFNKVGRDDLGAISTGKTSPKSY